MIFSPFFVPLINHSSYFQSSFPLIQSLLYTTLRKELQYDCSRYFLYERKPVLSLLLSMGIPMMLSMLINSLYNIVDGIFVARMSEDAMMAISLVYPVQNLLHSIAVGFGVGTNAVIAIFLGSRKGDAASSAASQGILLNLCHGLLFMVFGILFMRPFLNMFTSNETVIAYGMQYGIIVL